MINYRECHWGIDDEVHDRNIGIYILHQILKNENSEFEVDESQWEKMYNFVNGKSPQSFSFIPFLNRYPHIFSYKILKYRYREVIIIKNNIQLTLCKDHLSKGGCHNDRCMKLHCCKFFVYDACKFQNTCSYGHDLGSKRNKKILDSYMLVMRPNYLEDTIYDCYGNPYTQFSIYDLRNLLRQEYPRICKFYNSEAGCKYGVDGTNCMALHICLNYVMENGCSIPSCPLNHDLMAPQPSFIFSNLGYDIDERNCAFMLQALQDDLCIQDMDDTNELDAYYDRNLNKPMQYLPSIQNLYNINNSNNLTNNNYNVTTNNSQQQQQQQHQVSLRQQLLKKKIPDLIVCNAYNFEKSGCPHIRSNPPCKHLHLCSHFVIGTCSYGASKCRKSHDLRDPDVMAILKIQNIDVERYDDDEAVLTEIRKTIRKNKYKIKENMSASSSSSLDHISNEEMENDDHDTKNSSSNNYNNVTLKSPSLKMVVNNNNNSVFQKFFTTPKSSGNKRAAYTSRAKHSNLSNCKINTFVFVDLEATGLTQPRITEVSMVAVNRLSMESVRELSISVESRSTYLPRVINKLTLCVSPLKTIEQIASDMTGLSNIELSHQKNFDDDLVEMLVRFISRLEPPTCLVAHNGFRFDFPLLQAELKSVNRLGDLPSDLLCIDSLILFRSLDETMRKSAVHMMPNITVTNGHAEIETVNGNRNEACAKITDSTRETPSNKSSMDTNDKDTQRTDWWHCSDVDDNHAASNMARNNLTSSVSTNHDEQPSSTTTTMEVSNNNILSTPTRNKKSSKQQRTDWWGVSEEEDNLSSDMTDDDDISHPKYEGDDEDEIVTMNAKNKIPHSMSSPYPLSMFGKSTPPTSTQPPSPTPQLNTPVVQPQIQTPTSGMCSNHGTPYSSGIKTSYKLTEIHRRVMGKLPEDSHRAEDDALALVRCFTFTQGTLEWADANALLFSGTSPMVLPERQQNGCGFPYI